MEAEELSRRVEEILVPLRAGKREEGLRLLAILEEELGLKTEQKGDCAKCHVEDSEFCDEVNVALASLEKKRARLEFLESVGKESDGWCEHERRYQRTSGGDGDHCYVCEVEALRADVERLKTELTTSLLKEGEAFRLGEKAVLGLMEERDALKAQLEQAKEANKNLMEEHQALVRNAAVERMEAREEIAGLKERVADGMED